MTWREFELLVAEGFRRKGYRADVADGSGPDGGVDIELRKGSERSLVQCKHWRANRVGVEVVRELYGVMSARGAAGGFVVTSGRFSLDAETFAEGRNIELLDGSRLAAMLREVQAEKGVPEAAPGASQLQAERPSCPSCGSSMVKRVAQRGSSAGSEFWGCSTFPKCRGTRPA